MSTCTINIVRVAPKLITNNDAPSSLEAASIDEAIADEEQLIAKLEQQVKAAKARIRQYEAVFSPCRRLPPDVLGEVFLQIPRHRRYDGTYTHQSNVKLLVLVCKKWRAAALAVPRLWSHLLINVKKSPLSLTGLTAWFNRSSSVPKDLIVRSGRCVVQKVFESWSKRSLGRRKEHRTCFNGNAHCILAKAALAEALCKMPGRCNSITLDCHSPACAQNLERLIGSMLRSPDFNSNRSAFHSATTFTLNARNWETWPASSRFLSKLIPSSVTTLHLNLSYTFFDTEIEDLDVHFQLPHALLERLTTLELYRTLGARHLFPTLQHCRSLETLILDFGEGCFEEAEHPPAEPIVLSKLRTLNICNARHLFGLDKVRMPGLVDLSIVFDDSGTQLYMDDDTCGWFAKLVRGHSESNSTLRLLVIGGGTYAGDSLFNILRSLTALTHLTLDKAEYPVDLFSKLSRPMPYLSELKTLKLFNLYADVEKILHLSEFVEDRGIELETSCFDGDD